MKSLFATVLALALVTAGAGHAQSSSEPEGCSRDTDCKSQRICVQRQCVWPGEPPSDQPPPPPRSAEPPPPPPGYYPPPPSYPAEPVRARELPHHRGAFIRLDIGFGYLNSKFSESGTDLTLDGAAGSFSIAVGGTLARHQSLAFHIWDMEVTNPTLSANGSSTSLGDNTSEGILGLGPMYTVYSDSNWFFSATPSLTSLHSNDGSGNQGRSDWGFGGRVTVGKEWFVSQNWGLGISGSFNFSFNKDQNNGPNVTTLGTALNFSATWN